MGSSLSQPTSPQSEPAWSPPYSRRSTLDLVQACVLTLILCSWTTIHPDFSSKWRHTWRDKLFQTLFAIIAPEHFLWKAFSQLWESRRICLELKKLKLESVGQRVSPDEEPAPTVQSLPVPKDPVVFPANPSPANPETHFTNDQGHNLNARRASMENTGRGLWHNVCETWRIVFPLELELGFYIDMGGLELVPDGTELPPGFSGILTPRGGIELARYGLLPPVPSELITSDRLAKSLVCLQAGWMVIQCIARVAQSLPLTLLELHTLIQTIYAIFMYFLWFKKPYNLKIPTRVRVDERMLQELMKIYETYVHALEQRNEHYPPYGFTKLAQPTSLSVSTSRLPQFLQGLSHSPNYWLLSSIYGGLHLPVWKGHFPSNLERILWIASALSLVGLPFFYFCVESLFCWLGRLYSPSARVSKMYPTLFFNGELPYRSFLDDLRSGGKWGWLVLCQLLLILQPIGLVCVLLARTYLVVESFASLRNLPLGSYNDVRWVSFIPHF